jgi:peroxiredoxin
MGIFQRRTGRHERSDRMGGVYDEGDAMRRRSGLAIAVLLAAVPAVLCAQQGRPVLTDREKAIVEQMRKLRSLPDDERAKTTKRLAIDIRRLPDGPNRAGLADSLAHLATEGDPGAGTLQEVATTLAQSLREQPPAAGQDEPYDTLAQLVRYEHVQATSDDPRFAAAMAKLEADDRARQSADFTLADRKGKRWNLKELRGSVVLVNFWATWCPPCRKEMPDMEALYRRFGLQGLVILAISDEEAGKVQPYIAEHAVSYPILLDPGRKVNELFRIEGIPKSFLYDRTGKIVAQAIDMRTERQFLAMLGLAGIE